MTCASCGAPLRAPGVAPAAGSDTLSTVIPYKNVPALIAYYLGVFSIVCGALLGLPALVLGIIGLRNAAAHPEAKGKAHAWTGIVLGSIMTLVTVVVVGYLGYLYGAWRAS